MNHLTLHPNRIEITWGIRYLLFEIIFLPRLLVTVNLLFNAQISVTWLNVIAFVMNALAVLIIFRRFLMLTLNHALSHMWQILRNALSGLGLYWLLNFLLGLIFLFTVPDFVNVNDSTITELAARDFVPMAVSAVLLAPITEELLFRGALFGGLYNHHPMIAYTLSIAGFSFIHISSYIGSYPLPTLLLCFLQYVPAGFCLARAYRRSGSILTPIIMHTVVNAVGMLVTR